LIINQYKIVTLESKETQDLIPAFYSPSPLPGILCSSWCKEIGLKQLLREVWSFIIAGNYAGASWTTGKLQWD
jgi:hypothetical protein